MFSSLKEACYNQRLYGGKIYTIGRCYTELEEVDDEGEYRSSEIEDKTYYVLNVSGKIVLINGFMYIKELLLQYHNFKMYDAYRKLTDNNVNVYSVKQMLLLFIRMTWIKCMGIII